MAKLQKANTEQAYALTVFPTSAAPMTYNQPWLYVGQGRSYNTRRAYPKEEGGGGRRHNRSAPSATSTRPIKDSQVLTVTVLQDASKRKVDEHGESPHPKHPYRGRLQGKGPKKRNGGVLPPQPAPVSGRLGQYNVYGGMKLYNERLIKCRILVEPSLLHKFPWEI